MRYYLILAVVLVALANAWHNSRNQPFRIFDQSSWDVTGGEVKGPVELDYMYFGDRGVFKGYPAQLRLFFNQSHFDPLSLKVELIESSFQKIIDEDEEDVSGDFGVGHGTQRVFATQPLAQVCQSVQIGKEYALIIDCPNPQQRTANGIYEFRFRASLLSTVAASREVKTIESSITVILRPLAEWPLENKRGVWPPSAPNAVANLFEDYQSFSGVRQAYWHQGLDIRSELDPAVNNRFAGVCRSPVSGKVVRIVQYGGSDLYWSVMVLDGYGFIWLFHHLDPRSYEVKEGQLVQKGDVLGRIARWPASQNGHLYHHVHMNVVRPHPSWSVDNLPNPYTDGWTYYNPYDFLNHRGYRNMIKPYSDGNMYLFKHGSDNAFAQLAHIDHGPASVSGTVDIVLNFASEFNKTNNVPGYPYVLGVHSISYTLTRVDSKVQVLERQLFDMDRMGPNWPCEPSFTVQCSQSFLLNIHRKEFKFNRKRYQSVFNYDTRKVYYSITNASPFGYPITDSAGSGLDTTRFENGLYKVSVRASDWFENEIVVSRYLLIDN